MRHRIALSQLCTMLVTNFVLQRIVLGNADHNNIRYKHYLHPKCLNIADTAICSGVSIQVPQLPMLFNSSVDLDAFLVRMLNSTSADVDALCGSSLSIDVLALPACKAFTCANAARMLITNSEDEGRLKQLFSHCTSPSPIFTPCRSVCEGAVRDGNAYIDQNCRGNGTMKDIAKANRTICGSYSDVDCNEFLPEDMFSAAPDLEWDILSGLPWMKRVVLASVFFLFA